MLHALAAADFVHQVLEALPSQSDQHSTLLILIGDWRGPQAAVLFNALA